MTTTKVRYLSFWGLVMRSLCHYWRGNLSVWLGAALGTTILVGALAVGDSVRESLVSLALSRLGEIELAVITQDRFFRDDLSGELEKDLNTRTAPVLYMRGTATLPQGNALAGSVNVYGVDHRFSALGKAEGVVKEIPSEGVYLNRRLASQLNVEKGDTILLRVERPTALSREAPLSTNDDSIIALRVVVEEVAADSFLDRFSLQSNQVSPYNAFVPLEWLQEKVELSGRGNMILAGRPSSGVISPESANIALSKRMTLADASLELRELPDSEVYELRTDRVFIDPPLAGAALLAASDETGVLTYFVNEIRLGDRATPYSMISALSIPPEELDDDGILVGEWLADDLQTEIGDTIQVRYFVLGPMRTLEERTHEFKVQGILPQDSTYMDPTLMPLFPGLTDAGDCKDWESGFPIDLDKIRSADEDYWDSYRGTPKAFITLKTAQSIWGNRFGTLTAVRYPAQNANLDSLEMDILQRVDPASIGLFFHPVRKQALAASREALDFGSLFIGLSMFLIVSALLLMGLLFRFGIEQRSEEVGVLLALGFPPGRIRRFFFCEGLILSIGGGIVGTVCGLLYTRTILLGLSTIWLNAVGTTYLSFHVLPGTIFIGVIAGTAAGFLSIWLVVRNQASVPARQLLTGNVEMEMSLKTASRPGYRVSGWIGAAALLGAVLMIALTFMMDGTKAAGAFFGAGALLLAAFLSLVWFILRRLADNSGKDRLSIAALGIRAITRRASRSLSTIALLACGSFLIVAVGANRHNPLDHSEERSSGTGGFSLIGQTSLPVYHDLNSEEGLSVYGLSREILPDSDIIGLKVRAGDDASCLNLNRAQVPRLLGVDAVEFSDREVFTFVKVMDAVQDTNPWSLLDNEQADGAVPAIGDKATVVWALGKSVGDILDYTDERGNVFKIRIVAITANSILQGSLVISEKHFTARFPGEGGFRMFLLDTPGTELENVSKTLSDALGQVGLEIKPAVQRLVELNAVENTYLSIFQVLGGLGLLLGSAGLGIVVLRNILERRGELALLHAVGFSKRSLQWLVLSEHWFLLGLGLVCGIISALLAVLPALLSPGAGVPYLSLLLTLAVIFLAGALWVWLATAIALRGPLLTALREE